MKSPSTYWLTWTKPKSSHLIRYWHNHLSFLNCWLAGFVSGVIASVLYRGPASVRLRLSGSEHVPGCERGFGTISTMWLFRVKIRLIRKVQSVWREGWERNEGRGFSDWCLVVSVWLVHITDWELVKPTLNYLGVYQGRSNVKDFKSLTTFKHNFKIWSGKCQARVSQSVQCGWEAMQSLMGTETTMQRT